MILRCTYTELNGRTRCNYHVCSSLGWECCRPASVVDEPLEFSLGSNLTGNLFSCVYRCTASLDTERALYNQIQLYLELRSSAGTLVLEILVFLELPQSKSAPRSSKMLPLNMRALWMEKVHNVYFFSAKEKLLNSLNNLRLILCFQRCVKANVFLVFGFIFFIYKVTVWTKKVGKFWQGGACVYTYSILQYCTSVDGRTLTVLALTKQLSFIGVLSERQQLWNPNFVKKITIIESFHNKSCTTKTF